MYNAAPGVTLELAGAQRDGEFYAVALDGRLVNVLIVNLTAPAASTKATARARRVQLDVSRLQY
ncbi:MAG: hypothetical protein FJ312_07725 [SAR202 cluster bacterium]|nr:hypothetical protein [SAR202 cluster bacterium]